MDRIINNGNFKITINTKNISSGDIFFCFQNAEKYLTIDVFEKVSKLYCEVGFLNRIKINFNDKIDKKYSKKIYEIKNLKSELIRQLKIKYRQPDKLIAITGTKGKTSTAWFTMQMIGYCGIKCGYIGTIGVYLFNGKEIKKINQEYTLTTPDIDEFYRYIDALKQKGADVVIFEASSHALSQGRIDGLKINCGCFTNFSQDHLDYHGTMDDYFSAKSLLFLKYLQQNDIGIINDTDKKANDLKKICAQRGINVKTIGNTVKNDIKISSIKQSKKGQEVEFCIKDNTTKKHQKSFNFCTNILGEFQIFNLLETILICSSVLNVNYSILCDIIPKICAPIGRMQRIKNTNIFIDFAHTPKSLEESIKLLKSRYKKTVVVFGCGGDRDKQKRPIMCKIARKIADFVIITSDNPRFEKPEDIIKDITCFIKKDKNNPLYSNDFVKKEISKIDNLYKNNESKFKIIVNRSDAIFFTINKFYNLKYAILIAGKGHENYQIIGDKKIHFSDSEEAELALKKINKKI